MPPVNVLIDDGMLLRTFIYGPEKTKKTWWAAKAAEAGFNVNFLMGDDGAHVLKNIKSEAQKRINVVDLQDQLDRAVYAPIVAALLKKDTRFIYDETTHRRVILEKAMDPTHRHYIINLNKLTPNDILVLDSWTALTTSLKLRYYYENGIDMSIAAQTEDRDWGVYAWTGALADWITGQLGALNCHVVVIGHVQIYEKYKEEKINNKKVRTLEWQRTQPFSTSGPNSMHLGDDFSDFLYFYVYGSAFKIDTAAKQDRAGGSRIIPPNTYNWDDLQIKDICKMAKIPIPENAPPSEAFVYVPENTLPPKEKLNGGEEQKEEAVPKKAAVLIGNTKKSASLSGLLHKQKDQTE